jgi:hypothetical protein
MGATLSQSELDSIAASAVYKTCAAMDVKIHIDTVIPRKGDTEEYIAIRENILLEQGPTGLIGDDLYQEAREAVLSLYRLGERNKSLLFRAASKAVMRWLATSDYPEYRQRMQSLLSTISRHSRKGSNCGDSICYPIECNRCGRTIFYYRCSCGGTAFFDSLGYDWHKHKCQHVNQQKNQRKESEIRRNSGLPLNKIRPAQASPIRIRKGSVMCHLCGKYMWWHELEKHTNEVHPL